MTTIERILTSDPESGMENNTWLVGDDSEVIVIDPAHNAHVVHDAIGDRRVAAILLTHGHWDHVRAAVGLGRKVDVQPRLRKPDEFLWRESHPTAPFTVLEDGDIFEAGGARLVALATPGHTPGSTCFVEDSLGVVFTGDTLFPAAPVPRAGGTPTSPP